MTKNHFLHLTQFKFSSYKITRILANSEVFAFVFFLYLVGLQEHNR